MKPDPVQNSDNRNTMTGSSSKWYYRPGMIFLGILMFGPLGLIPLWYRPSTKLHLKISISFIVVVLTYYCTIATIDTLKNLKDYYGELALLMK